MFNLFNKNYIYTIILFFNSIVLLSQQNDEILKHIRNYQFDEARNLVYQIDDSFLKNSFNKLIYLSENIGLYKNEDKVNPINFGIEPDNDSYKKSIYNLNKGLHTLYYTDNSNKFKSLSFLKKSLDEAILTKNKILICQIVKSFLKYYQTIISIDDKTYTNYLKVYSENLYDKTEESLYLFYSKIIEFERASNPKIINKLIPDLYKLKNTLTQKPNLSRVYLRIGNYQQIEKKDLDSAYYYYNKAENLFKNAKKGFEYEPLIKIQSNKSRLMIVDNNAKSAIIKIKKILKKYKGYPFVINKTYLEFYLSLGYKKIKKYDSAYYYGQKSRALEKKLDQKLHLATLYDINTKYETEKKEKENLKLKQDNLKIESKRKENLYYLVASILVLFLGLIIGILTLKNSKRKQKLAEQYRALETQKNLTLLKEQELTTINAMVDGQEKERKRIAEDLHDNLGSVLATLKLHFENLKMNNETKKIDQETLFNKTENLIDEAYLKVRSIAHAKNAGVLANQGLLIAIKTMAEKISSADKIKIEVIDYGLDQQLDNSLEITVFRIIQELLTNILKHADAKNATINISLYDKNLNIIIEDDGDGFEFNNLSLKKGMGISSIITRIEHLEGSFDVDSTIGKGSSIIINIPIK